MNLKYENTIPNEKERKGSLFLRSNHMNYARATLNSKWHQAREAEPKDYDINKAPKRNLCNATYDRIGTITDGTIPETTYQDHSKQIYKRQDFQQKEAHKAMVAMETFDHISLDRNVGRPGRGFGAVLPRHNKDYNKFYLQTTHQADYIPPFPYDPALERSPDFETHADACKKNHSQFTDTSDYRHSGRNTWQDESGFYANSNYRQQVIKSTNPIPALL